MKASLSPFLLVLAMAGCGYRFTAGGAPLPDGIRDVFIPVVVNRTAEPALETVFTAALRDRAARSGTLGGTASAAQIQGEILSVTAVPGQIAPNGTLLSYRVSAVLRVRLVKTAQTLATVDVSGAEDYLSGLRPDVLTAEANRQAALRRLAATLASDAYERLASG